MVFGEDRLPLNEFDQTTLTQSKFTGSTMGVGNAPPNIEPVTAAISDVQRRKPPVDFIEEQRFFHGKFGISRRIAQTRRDFHVLPLLRRRGIGWRLALFVAEMIERMGWIQHRPFSKKHRRQSHALPLSSIPPPVS